MKCYDLQVLKNVAKVNVHHVNFWAFEIKVCG